MSSYICQCRGKCACERTSTSKTMRWRYTGNLWHWRNASRTQPKPTTRSVLSTRIQVIWNWKFQTGVFFSIKHSTYSTHLSNANGDLPRIPDSLTAWSPNEDLTQAQLWELSRGSQCHIKASAALLQLRYWLQTSVRSRTWCGIPEF